MQKAALAQRNQTNRNDADKIAHMMRVGWFRQVLVKDENNRGLCVLLSARRLLRRKLVDLEDELRGSLQAFGIKIGAVCRSKFEAHTLELGEASGPLNREGDPPALPGWQQKFDVSGSPPAKFPVVRRQAHDEEI
jgi:transposase